VSTTRLFHLFSPAVGDTTVNLHAFDGTSFCEVPRHRGRRIVRSGGRRIRTFEGRATWFTATPL
jgi:hypothetical protein